MAFRSLSKKAIGCMRLSAVIVFGVLTLVFLVARVVVSSAVEENIPLWADISFAAWVLLAIIYCIVAPLIRYRRYLYDIDDQKIVVREGLWFIKKDVAPIERVHQISVTRGPIDRIFGLGKVVVTTAGGRVVIRFLEVEEAERIADRLLGRVRRIVEDQNIRT
jgi:membrane protein YdbS with pleckstrin-like domain